jgi:hypothetical protein
MPQDVPDDRPTIQFMDNDNEALLAPKHDERRIYIPKMKFTLSVGHYIILSTATVSSVIGQIIGRSRINITRKISSTYAAIILYSI